MLIFRAWDSCGFRMIARQVAFSFANTSRGNICKTSASVFMAVAAFSEVQGDNLADILPVVPDCCIIIAISKASARKSVIYALQLDDGCIKGSPFQLYQPNGREYIWSNRTITRKNISVGSVLRCLAIGDILTYRSNTAKRMVGFIHEMSAHFVSWPDRSKSDHTIQ